MRKFYLLIPILYLFFSFPILSTEEACETQQAQQRSESPIGAPEEKPSRIKQVLGACGFIAKAKSRQIHQHIKADRSEQNAAQQSRIVMRQVKNMTGTNPAMRGNPPKRQSPIRKPPAVAALTIAEVKSHGIFVGAVEVINHIWEQYDCTDGIVYLLTYNGESIRINAYCDESIVDVFTRDPQTKDRVEEEVQRCFGNVLVPVIETLNLPQVLSRGKQIGLEIALKHEWTQYTIGIRSIYLLRHNEDTIFIDAVQGETIQDVFVRDPQIKKRIEKELRGCAGDISLVDGVIRHAKSQRQSKFKKNQLAESQATELVPPTSTLSSESWSKQRDHLERIRDELYARRASSNGVSLKERDYLHAIEQTLVQNGTRKEHSINISTETKEYIEQNGVLLMRFTTFTGNAVEKIIYEDTVKRLEHIVSLGRGYQNDACITSHTRAVAAASAVSLEELEHQNNVFTKN